MSKEKRPTRSASPDPSLERFRDLDDESLAKRIILNEWIRHDLDLFGAHAKEELDEQFRQAGFPFALVDALDYAHEDEKRGKMGRVRKWYEIVDEVFGDPNPLRAYRVRHGQLSQLINRFGPNLTDAELKKVGQAALTSAFRNSGWACESELETAFRAFTMRDDVDARAIRNIRERALNFGHKKLLQQIVERTGKPLTRVELLRIGRALIRQPLMRVDGVATYIEEHGLVRLKQTLINAMIRNDLYSYGQVKRVANRFAMKLSEAQLSRFLKRPNPSLHIEERVHVMEELARRSPAWRRLMPKHYEWARNAWLNWGHPMQAEHYGKSCGKPLTVDELHTFIADYHGDDRYTKELAFARDLRLERLREALGPTHPPNKKAAASAA